MTLNIISNFAANIALRNLSINGDEATKSVGKLSSGSRVVSAADDAAALAIGTRLNTEVQSLEQASINAGQAVSLLQVADGGLSRVQEMLTRMRVLATQSGSDNLSGVERALLDTEFQNLKLEIDRLTKDTRFNGISILASEIDQNSGGQSGAVALGGADISATGAANIFQEGDTNGVLDLSIRGIDNRAQTLGGDGAFTLYIFQGNDILPDTRAGVPATAARYIPPSGLDNGTVRAFDATDATIAQATAGTDLQFTAVFEFGDLDGDGVKDIVVKRTSINGSLLVNDGLRGVGLETGITLSFGNDGADFSSAGGISKESQKNASVSISIHDPNDPDFDLRAIATAPTGAQTAAGIFGGTNGSFGAGGLNDGVSGFGIGQVVSAYTNNTTGTSGAVDFDFKVGTGIIPDEDEINIKVGGISVEQLGLTNAEIRSSGSADAASQAVDFALDYLVNIRTDIGASVNRLETASDNIAISMENQEAARSRLLDLNVAAEITTFTSKQILLQSGISILAQSNQLPQNLLRLFA